MPVRKTTAKKAPAKKTTAKKTTPAKKSASPSGLDALADNIVKAIKSGQFDPYIVVLDNAITARVNQQVAAEAKKTAAPAAKKTDVKKVSAAPKRGASKVAEIKIEVGKTYKANGPAKLAGAKVKVIRFKEKDATKVVIEMVTDKPGYPKGKRGVIPASALGPVK